jgi:hypothetical protein
MAFCTACRRESATPRRNRERRPVGERSTRGRAGGAARAAARVSCDRPGRARWLHHGCEHGPPTTHTTAVRHVGGLHYATEKRAWSAPCAAVPACWPPTPTPSPRPRPVTSDPGRTSVEELTRWVEECGYHRAGQSLPGHLCDPMAEPGDAHEPVLRDHAAMGHDHAATERAERAYGLIVALHSPASSLERLADQGRAVSARGRPGGGGGVGSAAARH